MCLFAWIMAAAGSLLSTTATTKWRRITLSESSSARCCGESRRISSSGCTLNASQEIRTKASTQFYFASRHREIPLLETLFQLQQRHLANIPQQCIVVLLILVLILFVFFVIVVVIIVCLFSFLRECL